MKVVTKEYKVYEYHELTDEAKEKVKQWYLDGQEPFIFTSDCMEDLNVLFGETDLKIQYDLGYCQGDGFNIYGKINAKNILDCLENHNGVEELEQFENVLTNKEKKTILHYQEVCGEIELPYNNRYGYCMADYIEVVNDWEYTLENYYYYKNINHDALEKFENMVKDIFKLLCSNYEKWGYNYFYEIEDDVLEDMCTCNEYTFLVNGTFFE